MGRRRMPWVVLALVVVALVSVACRAESTVDAPDAATGVTPGAAPDDAEPGSVAPTATPEAPPTEPTVATATAEPSGPPPPSAPVTMEYFLGFEPSGTYAYESIGTPWEDPRACTEPARPAVVGIDVAASTGDELVGFVAGVEVVGHARQLVFGTDGTGVLSSVCGEYPDETVTLRSVRVDDAGRLVADTDGVVPAGGDDQGVWVTGIDGDAALIEVSVAGDEWTRELRRVDLATGRTELVEVAGPDEDIPRTTTPVVRSPDGRFAYRAIDDPAGGGGCEGFGVAASIAVDRGNGFEPVWQDDQRAYSSIGDLHFGPDGLIGWTSSCEGYALFHVGRMLEDGSIVDQHDIDTFESADGSFTEYQGYRINAQAELVALGVRLHGDDYSERTPVVRRIDLSDDPEFIVTGDDPPAIDLANPLAPTLAGTGEWYLGEGSTGPGGCGNRTLYASTSAGLVRGLRPVETVDAIVDLVVAEPRTVAFDDFEYRTRALVALTECPERYQGLRVWYGEEAEIPADGVYLLPAELEPVADVLSVRQEQRPGDDFFLDTIAEVVYRDGSIAEVVLEPTELD